MCVLKMHRSKTKKRKKRTNITSRDPLTRDHSRRHGEAVKKGMKRAKELKRAVLKAASVSRGKSKVEVLEEFLDVKTTKPEKARKEDSGSGSCFVATPREKS